jgi:5-deoxy-D-glucuronate isomerase
MNIKEFYTPTKDRTGRVYLMSYRNNGLSYAITGQTETKYLLCESPTLSSEIKSIISEHESYEEMRKAFFNERENR